MRSNQDRQKIDFLKRELQKAEEELGALTTKLLSQENLKNTCLFTVKSMKDRHGKLTKEIQRIKNKLGE